MPKYDNSIKPLPETQEQAIQKIMACHYCGKSLHNTAAVEAYDRTRHRRLELRRTSLSLPRTRGNLDGLTRPG